MHDERINSLTGFAADPERARWNSAINCFVPLNQEPVTIRPAKNEADSEVDHALRKKNGANYRRAVVVADGLRTCRALCVVASADRRFAGFLDRGGG